ncbi:transmembrane channel-like protein 7 [Phymastichus coffea]|uniref:transmembrane channel-like protein 7 n=1 Tax=Phymastichus coffea TaxID=108790 RepID=UPI00273CE7DA|nr:transmembrane channel-like protein 7 [Phymastichus coffea]XP_058805768.1 transmembrane channel-like protein 7 [Phymastichus coffea]
MSGGDKKKRAGDRAQGWDDAGAEFYQESYSAAIEADLQQVLQRDPSHIATLLPSKKSRVATTTKRVRHEPRSTMRRRTSTRTRGTTNTARRMSTNIQESTVSMLPDLSENLSNEERTWEEIMQIKAMPICMAQKIQLKRQLQNATKLRLQGFDQLKWQRRKAWQTFRIKAKETYSKMELWSTSIKKIGGNFGMGIVAYFLFIKWILFINLILFAIIMGFLVLPTIMLEAPQKEICNPFNDSDTSCCPELYWNRSREFNTIEDLFQSNNLFKYSLLFYGAYSSSTYYNKEKTFYYNLPLAYAAVMIVVFMLSLLAIIKSAAKGFRERVIENEGQFYQYCNLVFGGWDYCIDNEKSSETKHKALYNEIKILLESERFEEERQNRTREEKLKLCMIRLFVNVLVLLILCSSGIFIYYVIKFSFDQIHNDSEVAKERNFDAFNFVSFNQMFFEFLPYVCIVLLNIGIPVLFRHLVSLENYSPPFVVKLTLFRTVFLRFASLSVLLSSFYIKIVNSNNNLECTTSMRPLCWETFVGQQFLKLYITDFVGQVFMTFFINFPRSFIGKRSENKFLEFIGQQEFDLSKHVLDVVYMQTVCWFGAFFAPALPLFAVIGSFLLFYVKKFACLVNSKPPSQIYRATRSQSLFMLILLISFLMVLISLGYSFVKIRPSKACGPFKGLDSGWNFVSETFLQLPLWIRLCLSFMCTTSFGIPAFLLLVLLLYYYYAVSMANKNMVTVLKNQLVLEGHDKQFLLNRLSAFIKQQQEQNKYHQDHSEFT